MYVPLRCLLAPPHRPSILHVWRLYSMKASWPLPSSPALTALMTTCPPTHMLPQDRRSVYQPLFQIHLSLPHLLTSQRRNCELKETHKSNRLLLGREKHLGPLHIIRRARPAHQRVLPPSRTLERVPIDDPAFRFALGGLHGRFGGFVYTHGTEAELGYLVSTGAGGVK